MRAALRTVLSGNWTPKRLFLGGQAGMWLDPSDLGSMYQDSAATTPAAIDSPVGKILDKSGNGNHAVQATSSKRPILRAGGYLDFDGTVDCLQVTSMVLPTFILLSAGIQQTNAKPFLFEHSANATSNDGFFFYGDTGSSWSVRRTSVHSAAGVATWPGTSPIVAEFYYDGSGAYWKNGVVQTNSTITGTALANSNVTDALNIFSRNQAAAFTQGRLYGLVIATSTASPSQTKLRGYMAAKAGVTLP